jgi:hypothetical protein
MDEGKSWTTLVKVSTLIMSGAKVWGQKTPDGRFAMVYNPVDDSPRRYPLAIVTSEDGVHFDDFADLTLNPSFFASVPLMNPRTLCACQPVAFMISLRVAPSGRFSMSRTFALLLPSRASRRRWTGVGVFVPLGALASFLAEAVFFPDCRPDAPRGFCGAALAFLSGFPPVRLSGYGGLF